MPQSELFSQERFTQCLFDPDALPEGIVDPAGRPAPKRFSVYKNNVIGSYLNALGAAYPASKVLVGEAFFNAIGREFINRNIPNSQLMILFGAGFPDFLTGFEPAQQVPFLADVAQVERAWRVAYHSADIAPLSHDASLSFASADLAEARLEFLPSVHVVSSSYAVFSIWKAASENQTLDRINPQSAEAALIVRPDVDVTVHSVSLTCAHLIKELAAGKCLYEIAQLGSELDELFDFYTFFELLIRTGSIARIKHGPRGT